MKTITDRLQAQIERTANRLQKAKPRLKKKAGAKAVAADWRESEDPSRVWRRMVSLGLSDLGGKMLASDEVIQRVPSAIHPDKTVDLFERIIEENDLLGARFLHHGSAMANAVGRVTIRSNGALLGYGTGFLISHALMMTNNHVLANMDEARGSAVEFDFYERSNGQSTPTSFFRLAPQRFFITDEELDFTIVGVEEFSSDNAALADRPRVRLIAESGKILVHEPANVIQHPAGRPQEIAIKNNHVTQSLDDFLHYVSDTEQGSSGSPVFNMQWELAALHHSGVPKTDSQGRILMRNGKVFREGVDSPDDIAWVANEGVRVSSIVQHVRTALESDQTGRRELFEQALAPEVPSAPRAVHSPEVRVIAERLPRPAGALGSGSLARMTDEELDRLTAEQVAAIVSTMEDLSMDETEASFMEAASAKQVLVAEGDSWFDYSLAGLDIIDHLKGAYGYSIYNVAKAGDTLDNMAWGTKYDKDWRREQPPLERTLKAVERYKPKVVLLSGGGNDIAGSELLSYLNHADSGGPAIRESYANYILNDYVLQAYKHIVQSIWREHKSAHVIMHGYGYAVPDGRAVIRFLGFSFVGPWLRPALTAKGHIAKDVRQQIISDLIDRFNRTLQTFAASDSRLHYIDLRNDLTPSDWENELHLRNSAYRRVAGKFHEVIRSI